LQKFTNFHAIRSWNFRIFAMRWWPRFYCATLYKKFILALTIPKIQECFHPTGKALVELQNPNANSCWPRVPRVPTKLELIAPVFFELSCKQ